MSQYKIGTVTTDGTAVIVGISTEWLANVSAGDTFRLNAESIIYTVASIDTDLQITLSSNFVGNNSSVEYEITRDFTSTFNWEEIGGGDKNWTTTYVSGFLRKLDTVLGAEHTVTGAHGDITVDSITGSGALVIAAGGTNQNVTLTPSGTGKTLLNGNVGINISSPDGRLDVRDGRFVLSDTDIDQPATQNFGPNTYGVFSSESSTDGGLLIRGLSASNIETGLFLEGNIGGTSPTVPYISFGARKSNGFNGLEDPFSSDILYQFMQGPAAGGVPVFSILGNANIGIGATASFGTSARAVLAIANGIAPTTEPANMIQIYSIDDTAGSPGATLGLGLENDPIAIGTFNASHKIPVWINNVEYHIQLDAV